MTFTDKILNAHNEKNNVYRNEKKPAYTPKHRPNLMAWDKLVDSVNSLSSKKDSLEIRVAYLEKTENGSFGVLESMNERLKRLDERLKHLEGENWKTKLIDYAFSHKILTSLIVIFGIIVGLIVLIKI